ncbi:MAG TPA: FkbM family methyltransferase, partial [Flavobacteriaceae bacterium]|nr:FkbM family methyltransferase [Flavobacteriaceae bacterium]
MAKYQKLNTAGKKAFWKENPLNGNIEIKLDDFPSFSMYCENDDTVIKELYWTNWKGWENTSLALWANLLSQIQGGLILDIGSYTGIYAIIAAELNPSSSIYAFDIQEECINRIKKNLSLN